MTIHANLIATRALIDTPAKWSNGRFGGQHCLGTALIEGCNKGDYTKTRAAVVRHLPAVAMPIVTFNDAARHDEVLAVLDRAIAWELAA